MYLELDCFRNSYDKFIGFSKQLSEIGFKLVYNLTG